MLCQADKPFGGFGPNASVPYSTAVSPEFESLVAKRRPGYGA